MALLFGPVRLTGRTRPLIGAADKVCRQAGRSAGGMSGGREYAVKTAFRSRSSGSGTIAGLKCQVVATSPECSQVMIRLLAAGWSARGPDSELVSAGVLEVKASPAREIVGGLGHLAAGIVDRFYARL